MSARRRPRWAGLGRGSLWLLRRAWPRRPQLALRKAVLGRQRGVCQPRKTAPPPVATIAWQTLSSSRGRASGGGPLRRLAANASGPRDHRLGLGLLLLPARCADYRGSPNTRWHLAPTSRAGLPRLPPTTRGSRSSHPTNHTTKPWRRATGLGFF